MMVCTIAMSVGCRAEISYGVPQALPWWTSQRAEQCKHFGWATWGLFSWPFGRETRLCQFGGRNSLEFLCTIAILELFSLYSSLSVWWGVWRPPKWISPMLSPSCCITFQCRVNILILCPNSTSASQSVLTEFEALHNLFCQWRQASPPFPQGLSKIRLHTPLWSEVLPEVPLQPVKNTQITYLSWRSFLLCLRQSYGSFLGSINWPEVQIWLDGTGSWPSHRWFAQLHSNEAATVT